MLTERLAKRESAVAPSLHLGPCKRKRANVPSKLTKFGCRKISLEKTDEETLGKITRNPAIYHSYHTDSNENTLY